MKGLFFHFLLGLLIISFHGVYAQKDPKYVMSEEAYNETLRSLNMHVKYVTSLPGFREGGTPLFYLHRPGSRVRGVILIFHGFAQNAAANAIQSKFLFAKKFNVVSFNLAGFAQETKYWISAFLRKAKGYDLVRQTFLKDPILAPIIAEFQQLNTTEKQANYTFSLKEPLVPRILNSLRKGLPREDYSVAKRAIELLKPGLARTGIEKEIRKYFISGHQIFETDPMDKLHLLQALPGPVHTMGFSFGGVAVVNLAARSKVISKAVMLAPSFGRVTEWKMEDFFYTSTVLGSVDLLGEASLGIPGRAVVPLSVASSLLNRDMISNSMRETTKTLCIFAEDDTAVDVTHALEYCRSKLAAKTFVYPARLGLNHFITPETGSKYSNAMLEQIANYFITGNVDNAKFLIPN